MFDDGLVDEVVALRDRGLRDGVTASRALGYAQVLAALGDGGGDAAIAEAQGADVHRHPALRAQAAVVVPPRPPHRTGSTASRRPPWRTVGAAGAAEHRGHTYPEQVMFAKGHGTENDFVVLPDVEARLALTPAAVSALCDRRRGLGADGVLRVTTAEAALAAGVFERIPEGVEPDDWYMDYRNADGSIAQMCGNGVRVFAHYLRATGLEQRDEFVVGSLAGHVRSCCVTSMRCRPTSPSTWARPTSSAPVRPSSGGRRFAEWPSTWKSTPRLRRRGPDRRGARRPRRRRTGLVRRRAISRRRQRGGADRPGRRRRHDARARARSR